MSINQLSEAGFVFCAMGLLVFALGAATPPKAPSAAPKNTTPPPAPLPHVFKLPAVNGHLHVAPPAAKPKVAPAAHPPTKTTPTVVKKAPVPHFDARAYIKSHLGLATVHGEVLNAAGLPVDHVRASLRSGTGQVLAIVARRHITHSTVDGSFIMTNVRPGTYRIHISIGKKQAGVKQVLHAGELDSVILKI